MSGSRGRPGPLPRRSRLAIANPEDTVPSLILRLESLDDDLDSPIDTDTDTDGDPVTDAAPDLPRPACSEDGVTPAAPATAAPHSDNGGQPHLENGAHPLSRWRSAVEASADACLVLDATGAVVSVSPAAIDALGCADRAVRGRRLLDVIDVVDFDTGASHPDYAVRITPLATLGGRGLMRSLMRLRAPDGSLTTLDSTSAPLHDDTGETIGSVSFFATFATL